MIGEIGARSTETHERTFHMKVLGRTLGHLGNQLYKRRDLALIELTANCWDAGAHSVRITVPEGPSYDPRTSVYVIQDDGEGMTEDQVDTEYLVVGRNRRLSGGLRNGNRLVMGRKGVGKLAGFGMADKVAIETWRDGIITRLEMDVARLKVPDGTSADIPIQGIVSPIDREMPSATGTRIVLNDLKHKTPMALGDLRNSLGRRFSRVVRGDMTIEVNGGTVEAPPVAFIYREPADPDHDYLEHEFPGQGTIRYFAGYTESSIPIEEMQGFAVYVHEKTAQSPPFYFFVERTASGQHGTKYVSGEIHADFLDESADDDSDLVSTDRQEIAWESDEAQPLLAWGQALARRLLIDWASRKSKQIKDKAERDPSLSARIQRLDKAAQTQLWSLIDQLAKSKAEVDESMPLVDSLVRSFEYRHFHDLIDEIEAASNEDPEQLRALLQHLQDWKVLESRAILEIVNGRLQIIDKFRDLIHNDAAETAGAVGDDNMHDLIAAYPWLLNPDWQVLEEEKDISVQLKEWGVADASTPKEAMRFDFLALTDEHRLVVVEIKRSGHNVELDELHRLEKYKGWLARGSKYRELYMVMIAGNTTGLDDDTKKAWEVRPDGDILTWGQVHEKTRGYYEHYRAVLAGDVTSQHFGNKERELKSTREVLRRGSVYRGPERRRDEGLGPQDRVYSTRKTTQRKAPLRRAPTRASVDNAEANRSDDVSRDA